MLESNDNEANIADQHHENDAFHRPAADYSAAARDAYEAGDRVLAMHLYLTAYEEACKREPLPDMGAVAALREAWKVACELRERSIAEYIYDKLEPHLPTDEAKEFASSLQSMALDKLSEFGISRADLEDMADMISDEIGAQAHISRVTPLMSTAAPADALSLPEKEEEEAKGQVAGEEARAESDGRRWSFRRGSLEVVPDGSSDGFFRPGGLRSGCRRRARAGHRREGRRGIPSSSGYAARPAWSRQAFCGGKHRVSHVLARRCEPAHGRRGRRARPSDAARADAAGSAGHARAMRHHGSRSPGPHEQQQQAFARIAQRAAARRYRSMGRPAHRGRICDRWRRHHVRQHVARRTRGVRS